MSDEIFRVKVTGLRELQAAMRVVDRDFNRDLSREFKDIARSVSDDVQRRVNADTHGSGKAAGSVRPLGRQKGAAIQAGGDSAPYFPWLDFGGSVGRGHKSGVPWSGAIHRERISGGRYIYPTIKAHSKDILRRANAALVNAARKQGFTAS